MRKNEETSYQIRVKGASLTDWSGAVPEDINALLQKPGKDSMTLFYQIAKTQIELLCQAGKTDEAMEVWNRLQEQEYKYNCPLCIFRKDNQNGGAPYQGAHCFFGAFRESAADFGWFYSKRGTEADLKKASDKHLRKYVRIIPNHIFFYRDGKRVEKVDCIDGQQPVLDVKGFSRYEVIKHPFTFEFTVQVLPVGKFSEFLSNRDMVLQVLYHSTLHGQGSRRSAGFGGWKITEVTIEDWSILKEK